MTSASGVRPGLLINGLILLLAGVLVDPLLGQSFHLGPAQLALAIAGIAIVGLGAVVERPRIPAKILVPVPVFMLSIVAAEIAFRVVGYDFGRELEALQRVPIYFRQPRVPDGDIFFRREGPAVWEGDVLADGNRVTVAYDSLGFRNAPDLDDWEVVVVGDSFVEMGYLPMDAIFTSELARLLKLRVKNLGVSYVGPLTYCHYLAAYGKAKSTTDAVCVFYEGNDLEDLERELRELETFHETGQRPVRVIEKNTSFLKALSLSVNLVLDRARGRNAARLATISNASLVLGSDTLAVGVGRIPPGRSGLTPAQTMNLDEVLAGWSRAASRLHLRPWLAYMPCSRRVWNEQLVFPPETPRSVADATPSDLPELVQGFCAAHGVGFINLGPPLRKATRDGQMVFNPTDLHLSRDGGNVTAEVLAESLRR